MTHGEFTSAKGDWLVDPVWCTNDGAVPVVDWSRVPRSPLGLEVIATLQCCTVGGASLLLRGSVLEQADPHPAADIDVMLVTANPVQLRVDLSPLHRFGRPVDALVVDARVHRRDAVLWGLACTRALHVAGEAPPRDDVRLDRRLLVDHWLKYAAFTLPPTVRCHGALRVATVKQVVRSVGLVSGLRTGRFSRDLATCVRWAEDESAGLATDLRGLQDTVGRDPAPACDISGILAWLRCGFYARIARWPAPQRDGLRTGAGPLA